MTRIRLALPTFCTLFAAGYASVLISSPFDNFRIECPRYAGAQRLSIRMVESQGLKRQDTVYALSCNPVNEIYPWYGMPQEIVDAEREDCRYSPMFDPIMSHQANWSCGAREYIAGLSRVSDTRVQTECCRFRSRDETNCIERTYRKPFGADGRVEIEHQAKLINAILIDGDSIQVRFCDLTPRAIGLIMEDTTVATTPRKTTRPATTQAWTSSDAPATTEATTEEPTEALVTDADPTIPKRIIKVSRPWTSSTSTPDEPTTVFVEPSRVEPKVDILKEELNKREKVHVEFTTPSTTLSSTTETATSEATTTTEQPTSRVTTTEQPTSRVIIEETTATEPSTVPTERTTQPPTTTTPTTQPSTYAPSPPPSTRAPPAPPSAHPPTERPSPARPQRPSSRQPVETMKNIETMFPTKDYDNESADEAAEALMKSISEMMETRKVAVGLVQKVKAAGLPVLDGDALTKQLLRQVENEKDPQIADMLFKHSVEMLSTSTQTEATTTVAKTEARRPQPKQGQRTPIQKQPIINVVPSNHGIALRPHEASRTNAKHVPTTSSTAEPSYEIAEETIEADADIPDILHNSEHEQRRAPPRPVKVDEFLRRAPFDFSAFPSPPPSADSGPPQELPRKSGLVTRQPTNAKPATTEPTTTEPPTEATTEPYEEEATTTRRPRSRRPNAPQKTLSERRAIVSSARGGVLTSPYVDEETNNSPFDTSREKPREEIDQGPIDLLDPQRQDPAQPDPAVDKNPFELSAEIRRAPKPYIQEVGTGQKSPSQFTKLPEFPTFAEDRLDIGAGYVEVADLNEPAPPKKDGSRMFAPADNKAVDMPALIVYDAMPSKHALHPSDAKQVPATSAPIKNDLVPMNDPMAKSADVNNQLEVLKSEDEPATRTVVEEATPSVATTEATSQPPVTSFTEASEPPPALFGAVQPAAATDYDDDLGDNGGFPSWPMASDIARLPLKQEHTPPPYDIAAFYRTAPPPKRPQLRQKVLTFCTKENAIRDQNNLIVACGGDTDVWYPNRCPPGTDCFVAPDSSFRICCPVGRR